MSLLGFDDKESPIQMLAPVDCVQSWSVGPCQSQTNRTEREYKQDKWNPKEEEKEQEEVLQRKKVKVGDITILDSHINIK